MVLLALVVPSLLHVTRSPFLRDHLVALYYGFLSDPLAIDVFAQVTYEIAAAFH